jgi:PPP family 3-phenylpropionic acid transporter
VSRPRGFAATSGVWFFCLGGLGMFFPFFALFLRENLGLSGSQVGLVLAVNPLVGILVQPLWGQLGDLTGQRSRVLTLVSLAAAGGYLALSLADGFTSALLLTALLACFATPLVPTLVAVTLAVARAGGPHAFGLMRVWGTIGFLIAVVAFPRLLDALDRARGALADPAGPSEPSLGILFAGTALVVGIGGLLAFALPRGGEEAVRAPRGDWRRLFEHGPYVRLLGFALVAYFLLQGPMGIFPLFVRAHGGSVDTVSQLWIPMLLVEIPLVALSGSTLERFGARGLLAIGTLAGGVRWFVCALAPESVWLYPLQTLHGVTVAGLVLGAPLYVEAVVPARLRSTAQGVLAMVGVSLGGILSNVSAGWIFDHYGPTAPYFAAGVGALVLGMLVPLWLPAPESHGATDPT